ncbi:MAG: T9SS type A sorting domain-containing protein, partial [Bacteroidetes bacterium]|nr:T9SS type A sorting domain-containing protein [Bacteroidota bacterium]
IALAIAALLAVGNVLGRTIYVDKSATGMATGDTWTNAYTDLQEALENAQKLDQIWITKGIYTPGNKASSHFKMRNGVSLYGGFSGSETSLSERDPLNNITILSGEIGNSSENDNVNTILVAEDLTETIEISGFHIEKGFSTIFGAAGAFIKNSTINFSWCVFSNNQNLSSSAGGGAIALLGFNAPCKAVFTNCVFSNNKSGYSGGAVHTNDTNSSVQFLGCLFNNNTSQKGGAVFNAGSANALNCTFAENQADSGSAIYSISGNWTINNTIIWHNQFSNESPIKASANSAIICEYSIIKNGFEGLNNQAKDPLFLNEANYQIKKASPARNAADVNVALKLLPPIDLSGNPRLTYKKLDIGAYEYACVEADSTTSRIAIETCSPYTTPSGKTLTTTGIYRDIIENSDGCDSIITIDFTWTRKEENIDLTACDSITLNGKFYNKSGIYRQSLINAKGCDSILTINLTIAEVNTQVIRSGYRLAAQAENASFQWVDCEAGNKPIEGATSPIFLVNTDGFYGVMVTQNGCTKRSECFNIIIANTSNHKEIELDIFPNPFGNKLQINIEQTAPIQVYTSLGKLVYAGNLITGSNSINSSNWPLGIYTFKIGNYTAFAIKL